MTTIETTTTTIETPRDDFVIDDAQLAAVAFLARYSGRTLDAYRHDLRGFFQWAADNNLAVLAATRPAHRVVPKLDGRPRTGGVDDRPSPLDGVRLLPLRPHRRTNRLEPRAVRPSAAGAPVDRARTRPLRARRVPVHRRAVRPRPRRPGGASRVERTAGERGVRHQRRGPRHRTRPSHAAHPRQGQQARHHPARPSDGPNHRPGCRRTQRGPDPVPPRWRAPRPSDRAPLGSLHRQAGRPRRGAPAHAAGRVHHGRPRRWRAAAGRADSPPGTPTRRTTTIYDRRRQNFDRHAAYVVVAFVAGG